MAIGMLLVFGRDILSIPSSVAIPSGNLFLVVGFYITALATWDFMERPRPRGWGHLPALFGLFAFTILLYYYTFASPSFQSRVILMVSVASAMTLLQIIALWPMWRDRFHPMGKFLIVCLCLILAAHLVRLFLSFFSETPLPQSNLENNIHNSRVVVAAIVHSWLLAFGSIGVTAEKLGKRLRIQADRDPLTGLNNRRAFLEGATSLQARDPYSPFSVLAIDPDHFSRVNDSQGMVAGDRALRHFANLLSTVARKGDILAHIGGGEFALAMPGANREDALTLAETARALVEQHPAPIRSGPVIITVSIGVATLGAPEPGCPRPPIDTLLQMAEETLAAAKESGRNRLSHKDFSGIPS
ncbi:GGDEF domain-containing protein [Rhodospirillum sp. A1_3_36]|uniref:GGDEF domain-containing protein n=1 Tax=Rhodospirillum sp. A1_3_36 TaxID=3391666 RepID=UPI0039A6B062